VTAAPRAHLRKRLAAERLAVIWLACLVSGSVALLLRRADAIATVEGVLLPCLILLIYFFFGIREKNKNTAKFADSLYFMGFLWTLAALIDAVVSEEMKVNTVFQAFGYALSTTGLGMALRVAVLQFQRTLPDQLEEGERSLEQSITALLDSLGRATQAADAIGRDVVAKTAPRVAELESVLGSLHSTFENVVTAMLQETATTVDSELERASSTIYTSIEPIAASVGAISKLPEAVDALRTALEELHKTLDTSTERVSRAVNVRINETVASMRDSEQAVRSAGDAARKLSAAVDEIVAFLKQDLERD
jgi:hypothetical protein